MANNGTDFGENICEENICVENICEENICVENICVENGLFSFCRLSLSPYCALAGKLEGGGGSGQSNLSADFPFRDILPQNTSLPFAQNTMSSLLTEFYFYLLTLDKILLLPSDKILFLSSHTIPFLASHKILFLRSLICALFCQINSMMTEVFQGVCSYFDP